MKITDEILSAFIDGELSPQQMEEVRTQIAADESLADRLAALQLADRTVSQAYAAIDDRPLPDAVSQMLAQDEQSGSEQPREQSANEAQGNNVVAFPWWRRAGQAVQQHAAIAATLMLAIGFGLGQLPGDGQSQQGLGPIANVLNTLPSGNETQLNDSRVKVQGSFVSRSGNYCRVFVLQRNSSASHNIACRSEGNPQWQQKAQIALESSPGEAGYQTASGPGLIDGVLDKMMTDGFMSAKKEEGLMAKEWGE